MWEVFKFIIVICWISEAGGRELNLLSYIRQKCPEAKGEGLLVALLQ